MPKYLDRRVRSGKWQAVTSNNADARYSVPSFTHHASVFINVVAERTSDLPHPDKFNIHIPAERLLEPLCNRDTRRIRLLEQFVSKGNLFWVVFWKESDLTQQSQESTLDVEDGQHPHLPCEAYPLGPLLYKHHERSLLKGSGVRLRRNGEVGCGKPQHRSQPLCPPFTHRIYRSCRSASSSA